MLTQSVQKKPNWLARGAVLGATVGALVVAIPLLDLSRTNYKFPWLLWLPFAALFSLPGIIVGLVVFLRPYDPSAQVVISFTTE